MKSQLPGFQTTVEKVPPACIHYYIPVAPPLPPPSPILAPQIGLSPYIAPAIFNFRSPPQDYPKNLPDGARVGFTVVNQVWAAYSPVKNSPADARAKGANGDPSHSAASGELDMYRANCEVGPGAWAGWEGGCADGRGGWLRG